MDSVPSEESLEWEDNDEIEIETDEDDESVAEMEEDKENYEDDDGEEEDPNNSDDMEMEELTGKKEANKRNGTEKLSAAALCVAVGSFCDPEDLPGLAHFLEHMVFMGSLKYPDENGFDAFLKKHGGSDNASTDCERTVFHFDIQQKYFKEALDRWAQFFIHPLMIRDAIDREVEAVDSETLDTLEKWVKELFSQIPNNSAVRLAKELPEQLGQPPGTALIDPIDHGSQSMGAAEPGLGAERRQHVELGAGAAASQELADPIDYVESLCENIHIFCKEDFLTGDQLLLEYKPEIIADVLNQLCPLRANLVLLSAASERECHLKERWFGTQYSVEDIDKYWSDLWASDFQLNQDLHFPEENKYIATDFALKASDCPDTEYPVKILSTQHGCVWYKKDNKFKIPKGQKGSSSALKLSSSRAQEADIHTCVSTSLSKMLEFQVFSTQIWAGELPAPTKTPVPKPAMVPLTAFMAPTKWTPTPAPNPTKGSATSTVALDPSHQVQALTSWPWRMFLKTRLLNGRKNVRTPALSILNIRGRRRRTVNLNHLAL
ncbi:Nardilysin [Chelonia mydas]|uniref:Nardilysin n=1 Tax=Chelonia mydas TaxID=8469 RepID=M7BNI1_CHEMY|nr:Nardilysin [Chelonia mydas]